MKKIFRKIDVIYWLYIFISTIFTIIDEMSIIDLYSLGYDEKYIPILIVWVIICSFFITFVRNIFLTAIYIGAKIATKNHNKERLDKIDFENKEKYYRDIIKDYSPGVLNYIDNFHVNINTIVATIMSLKLKRKINDELEIIDNENIDLDLNEKYIFDKIKNNEINSIELQEYQNIVVSDCHKYNLLKIKNTVIETLKYCGKIFLGSWILGAILFFSFILLMEKYSSENIHVQSGIVLVFIIGFLGTVCGIVYSISYLCFYFNKSFDEPYIRTKKAKEINEKLEGLKKYIIEYSFLDERGKDDLQLWEEYLIYSVIFGINQKIVEEYKEKINLEEKN